MQIKRRWQGLHWLCICIFILVLLSGCQQQAADDIVVLYTNDVHCAVDAGIGYAGLSAYKQWMEEQTPYVTLVDCGDAVQGDVIGTVSQGAYLTEIMNAVGYDFAVLGNHEFNYGMERLAELISQADAVYLGCNICYTGDGENQLAAVQPYEIVSYGDVQVGFIGVSTPESIVKSSPAYFMDQSGNFIYDFYGETGEAFYAQVQQTVDDCRAEGADYVIVLSHLGIDEVSAPFRSTDLIANTSGIDAVLDGHSHSVIPCDVVANCQGEKVLLSSTGSSLQYIGRLVITAAGNLQVGLIGNFPDRDEETEALIQEIQSRYQEDLQQVIAYSDVELTTASDDGIRLIRNRETNLGDFCADAYRAVADVDIALVNGGGIRADLSAGDITYGDIIAVHPYGNTLCVVETTGQQIVDALEMGSRFTTKDSSDGVNAVGENGGFLQVAGLKYTIDTSVESTVETTAEGMYVSCGSNRRVKDVQILQEDGSYAPIDLEQTYTLASHSFLIKQGGDGLNMFMNDPLLVDEGMSDYQILIDYLTLDLNGEVGENYRQSQGRITVL